MKNTNLINIILILATILIGISFGVNFYKEKIIEEEINESKKAENNPIQNIKIIEPQLQEKKYPKANVITEYKGYKVCAKIEIPTINLETYILQDYSIKALNVLPTKFWGVNPNEIGNFCIAGHNFRNENMFRNLKKLNITEKIILSDNTVGIIEYEIFDIYTVLPDDTDCLSQETNGKREITLITCTSDSTKRVIVKAREINN